MAEKLICKPVFKDAIFIFASMQPFAIPVLCLLFLNERVVKYIGCVTFLVFCAVSFSDIIFRHPLIYLVRGKWFTDIACLNAIMELLDQWV